MRLLAAALLTASTATAAPAALPRSTPESEGVSSSAILAFVEAAEQKIDSLHSLMVLRHGQVVAEGWWKPYRSDAPHVLFSLSKSFASTGIGLAIAEGRLSLDDTVASFFPGELPPDASSNLKAMRVRDLLAMSTGHHQEAIDGFPYGSSDPTLTRVFLALPVAHKPGTHFVYNTPASYMLSAIVQKATGSVLVDYLRPRLLDPIGIGEAKWDASPQGVSYGGFGLSLTTEDIARFGQLYLRRGEWNGERVLPAEWVDAATARQVSNGSKPDSDWEQGYGYQFWRCRHGVYRGDGAFGQFCVVLPKQDAVVAITSGTQDLQGVLNLVWQHLLPAMQESPLATDDAARGRLESKLAGLALAPPKGQPTSRLARRVSGRIYELPKNDDGLEAIGVVFDRQTTLLARSGGREYRVPVGSGEWGPAATLPMGRGRLMTDPAYKAAASGAWTDEDTFTIDACFYETPFRLTLALHFAGDALVLDQQMNVAFGPTKRPTLVGVPRRAPRAAAAPATATATASAAAAGN
jgi:CubicO group peptidase (beta-lactamase class C family)